MKQLFLPFLTLLGIFYLTAPRSMAQVSGSDVMNIAIKGDANTEQSAKLELIRILEERMNKLTVAQLNSRVIVSSGVKSYYKVAELVRMFDQMWSLRVQIMTDAEALKANPGFGEAGNNFVWVYVKALNEDITTMRGLKDQLTMLLQSGQPIQLPAMPTFSVSPATSPDQLAGDFTGTMKSILSQYNIQSQDDIDKLPANQRAAFDAATAAAKADFEKQLQASLNSTTKSSLTLLGNVIGMVAGVPGAGSLIAGIASGNASSAISGLVGSIVDKFNVPDNYYDSSTLKLTDAERLKMIDEMHSRMSDLLQKDMALRANMNSEVKKRYDNISQSRNEVILYGPKKK